MAEKGLEYIFRDIVFSTKIWTLFVFWLLITGAALLLQGAAVESLALFGVGVFFIILAALVRVGDMPWKWSSLRRWGAMGGLFALGAMVALFIYTPAVASYILIICVILGAYICLA